MFFHFYHSQSFSNQLIVFHGLYRFSDKELSDYIMNEHLIHRFPEKVIILLSIQNKEKINIRKITEMIKDRFSCESSIYFYDKDGYIYKIKKHLIDGEDEFQQLLEDGIKELEVKHTPIIKPTHGHQFLKPSKERGDYFIRLDNMLIKESEISFLALLIVRKLGNTLNEDVINIYVDTPDLFYLIRLCCAIKFNDRRDFPHIKSFNSYDGYQEILPRESQNSIIIISASSSGDLPRIITSKFPIYQKNKITTILSTQSNDNFTPLHKLNYEPKKSKEVDTPLIKIYGEKFIISHKDDKWVVLKKRKNSPWLEKNRSFSRFQSLITDDDCIILEKNIDIQKNIEYPIKINTENLLKNQEFKTWCCGAINWHIPKTTKLVIYLDKKSEKFLNEISTLKNIKKILFDRESDNIRTSVNDESEDFSILVFAPVLSYGSVFTEISSELRKHEAILNINYIAGICTVPNIETFNYFKANIEMSSSYRYNFHNYFTMSIGNFRNFSGDLNKEKEIIDQAFDEEIINQPQKEKIINREHIFHTGLDYTDGFVFWEAGAFNDEHSEKLQQISVFSTIAMVLQCSRELPVNDECSLQPSHLNGVVLSPENFFRFNDTMIQAAILRSARFHELNYTNSKEKSISMQYFILNSIKSPPLFYEILLSMATGKLLLHNEINIEEDIKQKVNNEKKADATKYWDIFKKHINENAK